MRLHRDDITALMAVCLTVIAALLAYLEFTWLASLMAFMAGTYVGFLGARKMQ